MQSVKALRRWLVIVALLRLLAGDAPITTVQTYIPDFALRKQLELLLTYV